MKKCSRALLPLLFALALGLLFLVTASAVPPSPGSGWATDACPSHPDGAVVRLSDLPRNAPAGSFAAPAANKTTDRDIPLVIIAIGFKNLPYEPSFDWAKTIFEDDRSLSAYYTDQSYGQFTFTPVKETSAFGVLGNNNVHDRINDGVVHVTLDLNHEDWSLSTKSALKDARLTRSLLNAFTAAIQKADAYVDFSSYDRDGDGLISKDEMALGFVVAGYEAAYDEALSLGAANYLWSHAWGISQAIEEYGFRGMTAPKVDGVTVTDYIAIAEKVTKTAQEPISVLAHELGHYLGLPDLYDTEYNNNRVWSGYDVGLLSVMCSGGWGTDPDGGEDHYLPYSFDVWSKVTLGWITPKVVDGDGEFSLKSIETNPDCLLVKTGREREYYLLENRRFSGWDAGMATDYPSLSGGVVLWHIDEDVYDAHFDGNTVNNTDHRPAVMPLFPEELAGKIAFIGNTDSLYLGYPFFDAALWKDLAKKDLGPALDLPLYGTGKNADKREGRTLSGVCLTFVSNSADRMTLRFGPETHVHTMRFTPEEPASCSAPGKKAYYTCTGCSRTYLDAEGADEVTSPAALVLPKNGRHVWDAGTDVVPATCVSSGTRRYACTLCKTAETRAVPAGHRWTDTTVNIAPTCTASGSVTLRCGVCGKTQTAAVSALGHRPDQNGVCVRCGQKTAVCALCGRAHTGFFARPVSVLHAIAAAILRFARRR